MYDKAIVEYDENGNRIHCKFLCYEFWFKYDENNNKIYEKNHNNEEYWYKYNENNNQIEITEKEYKNIEFRKKEKEYNSRTKCSRFELIEI